VETQKIVERYKYDIFLPKYNLAVEHHGLYWHCEKNKDRDYHLYKMATAIFNNIRLLQFWEDEWEERKDVVKSIIKSKIEMSDRIYARKCNLVELDYKVFHKFCCQNHLQGRGNTNIEKCLGLLYNNELVIGLSLAKHHRNINQIAISRICSKIGISVVGGVSKLLSECPRPIITWTDNRYSTGQSYQKMGFVLEYELPPDYQYVKNGKRFSKQSLKKTKADRLTTKTEFELRSEQGYYKIWDVGKKRWILN